MRRFALLAWQYETMAAECRELSSSVKDPDSRDRLRKLVDHYTMLVADAKATEIVKRLLKGVRETALADKG